MVSVSNFDKSSISRGINCYALIFFNFLLLYLFSFIRMFCHFKFIYTSYLFFMTAFHASYCLVYECFIDLFILKLCADYFFYYGYFD